MTKYPEYYDCDMAMGGDTVTQSCEDLGHRKDVDKNKKKCFELRSKWVKFRKSLPDWKDEEEDE